jgi:LCP family protein required for cell wall assembly
MPPEQRPEEPAYDWLYAGQDRTPARNAGETELIPPAVPSRAAGGDRGEHTQVLGVPASGAGPPSSGSGERDSAGQSFGGTYTAPSSASGPGARYAPPASPPQRSGQPPRRPPPPSAARTRPSRKRRNWWLRGVLLVLAAWLVFLVAVPLWAWSHLSKVDAEPGGDRPADTGGTTYLLVGSDSREGLSDAEIAELGTGGGGGQRTDTILLLDIPTDGPTLLLSIPRDSFVDIPGNGQNKINAAYSIGGPDLLVRTVEGATGVRVDNYIEVGFSGFVDAVDAVGGIEVCPKTSINDPKAGNLTMKKGCQQVDGHTALDYSRSRAFPQGDITRALHQREVIAAVGKKTASWQTFVFPWRYWRINMAAAETLQVGENVGPLDLGRFAEAMASSGSRSTKRCVVPYSSLATATSAGTSVIWDEQRAGALFAALRAGDTSRISCSPH